MFPAGTRDSYVQTVGDFLEFLGKRSLQQATPLDAEAYLLVNWLTGRIRRGSHRTAVEALEHFAAVTPELDWGPGSLGRPVRWRPAPVSFPSASVRQLFKAPIPLKNRVMLDLLYRGGLRPLELLALTPGDLELFPGTLSIPAPGRITGRIIYLPDDLADTLETYLQRAAPEDFLFEARPGQAHHPAFLKAVLREAAQLAGLKRRIGSQTLRYTRARQMLEGNKDPQWVARWLGWGRPRAWDRVIPDGEPER